MVSTHDPQSLSQELLKEWHTLEKEFISQLFFNSPIGIYILQNGRFRFVNPEFQHITGYQEDELKGTLSLDIVHPEDRDMVRSKAVEMLKGHRSTPYLGRIVRKNGETRYILESVCSISYRGQRSTLGYFMDNTEQELIKEALRQSEEKFHKAFRSSPDWVVISTLDNGTYLEVNQAFLHTTGFTAREVIGRTSTELGIWVDPDERDELHQILGENGRVCNAEVRFRVKSGEVLHVLWSAEVIEYGGRQCLIAVARDITDRKLAEQEQMRREKLQGVLEMAGAACHEMNQPLQNIFFMLDDFLEAYPESQTGLQLKEQMKRIRIITGKLERITTYETKDYIQGTKIIDIDKASLQCPVDPGGDSSSPSHT
ncbi:PAS domain-containing protein [Desulfovermiculus halophilus]|jgi:PAS domain S-box-containing protein|uniref:PAS domain-containing protein n=1 Tax=Desulfovermiculus halophilus TaxID=339722 RepID=UPI0004892736|nr:PAS domain-containing protein [Desulfovermiculus halophilus]